MFYNFHFLKACDQIKTKNVITNFLKLVTECKFTLAGRLTCYLHVLVVLLLLHASQKKGQENSFVLHADEIQ
jgi:hypothetical protein